MTTDVLIIGGGVGGLACAMTLASAHGKAWFAGRTIAVVDDDQSDLAKARLRNAPGVPIGTLGTDVLEQMQSQVVQYGVATVDRATVASVARTDVGWSATATCGRVWKSHTLVLATGFKRWDIQGLPCTPTSHPRGGKLDRIMLEHDGIYHLQHNLHVAGLLAGGSSQFAIAAGSGAQVAVEILSVWAGKRTHIHDVPESPTC